MWDLEQEPGPEQEDYWAWEENVVMLMRVIDPSDAGTRGRGAHTTARKVKSNHWSCINKELQLF
jgi:hypothetical protein